MTWLRIYDEIYNLQQCVSFRRHGLNIMAKLRDQEKEVVAHTCDSDQDAEQMWKELCTQLESLRPTAAPNLTALQRMQHKQRAGAFGE